jgi:flagellar basal body rod protein FlgC
MDWHFTKIDLFDRHTRSGHALAMNSIDGYALAGLNAVSTRISIRAENIANLGTEGYRPIAPMQTAEAAGPVVHAVQTPPDRAQKKLPGTDLVEPGTSLEGELVDTIESTVVYKVSAKVLKTSQELDKALFDIIA